MRGVLELARAIAAGELSAAEAAQASLDRIAERNPELNAVTRTLEPYDPPPGPLHGVPFCVKENIDVAGTVTSMGMRGGTPAAQDAPHIAHLRAAGAVPIARGNLPDLALRWHTDNARHGATINPHDASLSPGGSSGGDAVALASGMVAFAVGSDYGGSLRVPAALAGVYSLRPTPGRLAQAFAAPPTMTRQLMATDGPLTTRAEDLGPLFDVMAQPSPRDPRYTPGAAGARGESGGSAAGARGESGGSAAGARGESGGGAAGARGESGGSAAGAGGESRGGAAGARGAPRVTVVLADDATRRAADALAAAGYDVIDGEARRLEEAAQLWLDLVGFEANLGPLQRLRDEGSEGTRRSAEALFGLARPLDGAGYAQALATRYAVAADWQGFYLGPVSTAAPWPVGHDQHGPEALRDEWWGFRLTVATACLGLPAVSTPNGVQLIGPRWSESGLIDAVSIMPG